MKKLLALLIVFSSCTTQQTEVKKYVIMSKNYAVEDMQLPHGICEFWYDKPMTTVNYHILFQDSCNKYKIGDTLK